MVNPFVPIPGFPDYEMTRDGRVRRYIRSSRSSSNRIMATYKHEAGYRMIGLSRNGKRHKLTIAHVLLLVFKGPQPTFKHEARHLDGNPSNDDLDNLEWGTRKQNISDAIKHGTHRRGAAHSNAKLTQQQADQIRDLHMSGSSQCKLSIQFDVNRYSINRIITGQAYRREWSDRRVVV